MGSIIIFFIPLYICIVVFCTVYLFILYLYTPARIVIFILIFSSALSGYFLFFGQTIFPYQKKNFSEKNFLFRKKIYFFGGRIRKKFIFYNIFSPPYILLRSVKTITVGISYLRQNKLVRREYIFGAGKLGGKEYLGRAR
jgi:hypothetical protein